MTTALALTTCDLATLHTGDALERIAVVDGERRFTYGELQAHIEAVGARLAELGVARGDRVVVHVRKSFEEVVAMFACWRIGAVAVNVNSQWTLDQLRYVVGDSGARVAILDAKRGAERGAPLPAPLQHAIVRGPVPDGAFHAWPALGARAPERRLLDTDLAAILYTSGSTGSPKGFMLTHSNLLAGERSVARYTEQRPDDRLLGLLPFSFDYGLNQLLTACLLGARVVMMPIAMPSAIVSTLV